MKTILKKTGSDSTGAVFFKGAVGSFVAKVAGAGLLFTAQVVLARLLGADQYGIYAYVLSWMTILAIVARLGFETSLLRFLPEYRVQRDWPLFRGIIRFSFSAVGVAALALLAAGQLALSMVNFSLSAELLLSLRIMLFTLPLFAWTAIRQSCLRGLRHVVLAELPEGVLRPLALILAAWMIAGQSTHFNAAWAWLCQFIAVALSFAVGTWLLIKALPADSAGHPLKVKPRQWLRISTPMLLMNSMNIVMSQASIVILGFYRPPDQVAVFSAGVRIVLLASFALLAVNSIAAPLISEHFYAKRKNELQVLLRHAAAAIGVVTLIAAFLLTLGGRWILGLFGHEFVGGYTVLLILLAGFVVKSLVGPASYLLNLTGRQNLTAKAMAAAVLTSLALNFALVPKFGALGAALAFSATMIIWNITLLVLNVKIVGINPSIFSLFTKSVEPRAAS